MHPIICAIGPFTVYSYGLMLAIAFLIGSSLARFQAQRQGLDPQIIFNLAFIAFISGILGARIFYIIEHINYYLKDPREIIMLQHGGLSWYGGLFLGSLCGVLYIKKKELAVYKVLDLIVPFVALGQAIGRIGCLLNGCCFGKVSEYGIYFTVHQAVLVPTQLYSSLLALAIFIILRLLQDRPHREGQIFFDYLMLYSFKRFFIEFWRSDNQIIFFGLTIFQAISIFVFAFSFFKLTQIKSLK